MFDQIEKLKHEYTDKYVVVDARMPELRRFEGHVGQVKTVNMSGRALVQFDVWNNIGWYDIDLGFLKVVPKPEATDAAKAEDTKHAAPRPAAKAAPAAAAAGEKKLSPLEMARMQGAAKGPAAPATGEPAAVGAKKSTADILAAARANKAAAAAAEAQSAAAPAAKPAAAKPAGAKMNTADILAAARAKKSAEAAATAAPMAPAPAEADEPAAAVAPQPQSAPKAASAGPAFPPGQRPNVPEILAWCREHDSK